MPSVTVTVECEPSGVWVTWRDGWRGNVDQTPGFLQGTLATIEQRLAAERTAAQEPTSLRSDAASGNGVSGNGASGDLPSLADDDTPRLVAKARDRTSEGGLGTSMLTQVWSGTDGVGIGPRLDVSIGPPGPLAFLLSESATFSMRSSDSQVTMFDFQGGVGLGAPFKTGSGVGAVFLFGAERMSVANSRFGEGGLWQWTATATVGGRASMRAAQGIRLWLGADLLLRTNTLESGGTEPASIPATSFLFSVGAFFPAFRLGAKGD